MNTPVLAYQPRLAYISSVRTQNAVKKTLPGAMDDRGALRERQGSPCCLDEFMRIKTEVFLRSKNHFEVCWSEYTHGR